MKNANSKMMERIAEIENCVLGGLVLDDRGTWVSIADKKSAEEDFLVHLEAGRVLYNGRWGTFADAKNPVAPIPLNAINQRAEEETTVHTVSADTIPDTNYPPETALFSLSQTPANQYPAKGSDNIAGKEENSLGQYPPETKSILVQPVTPEMEETGSVEASSYTMETGLFVIDHSVETAQALQSETKPAMAVPSAEDLATAPAPGGNKTKRIPAFVPPSIPTWEKEESKNKKRTLIIGGIVVAVIGITAIAIIILQVVR